MATRLLPTLAERRHHASLMMATAIKRKDTRGFRIARLAYLEAEGALQADGLLTCLEERARLAGVLPIRDKRGVAELAAAFPQRVK